MNIETANELIASLESAGELSIKESKYLELAKAYVDREAESVALALTFEKCREVSGCPEGVDLQDHLRQLAAENVELASSAECLLQEESEVYRAYNKTQLPDGDLVDEQCLQWVWDAINATPATDRIYAGIKADGRVEGINFAASRLAAAFNHGFVDKPMTEVGDVVRMILDAKADLANSPTPPEDGLSGEYAETSLTEWEVVLREGADK